MNSNFEISSPHSVNLSKPLLKERPLEISITLFSFLSKSLGEARPARNLELNIIIEKKNFTKEKTKEKTFAFQRNSQDTASEILSKLFM